MNKQINLRLSEKIFNVAQLYAKEHGFMNVQEFVRELIRDKLFDEGLSVEELDFVKKLSKASEKKNLRAF